LGAGISPSRPIGGVIDGLSPTRLKGKRVLGSIAPRNSARTPRRVGAIGCVVETAETAGEALGLAPVSSYDAVILDVKPSDMKGSEAFMKLREAHPNARMILMAEFGYDGEHTLVRLPARGTEVRPVQAVHGQPTRRRPRRPRTRIAPEPPGRGAEHFVILDFVGWVERAIVSEAHRAARSWTKSRYRAMRVRTSARFSSNR